MKVERSIEARLAQHVASCPFEALPEDAIAAGKRSIVDGVAAMLAGRRADGIQAMLDQASEWGGAAQARVPGTPLRLPAPLAAWCIGGMMRALELDDCTDTLPLHPTAAILPTLIAIADLKIVSGRDFLRALVIAQDLKIRFGLAVRENAMQTGRNNLFRVFAVAGGAAALLGLDSSRTLHALGLSASYAAGDAQCIIDGSMGLRVQFGNTASGGLQAALLAARGITGPVAFLTGDYGYFRAFEPQHDLDALSENLGREFRGTMIATKPYASCRCTHAVIDLCRDVRDTSADRIFAGIERIDITVAPQVESLVGAPREAKLRPRTSTEAQFSIHFTAAAALLQGRLGIRDTMNEALEDQELLRLAEKIHVTSDPSAGTANVIGRTDLKIRLVDGTVIERSTTTPLGGIENPITPEALMTKLADCCAFGGFGLTKHRLEQFVEGVEAIENEADVSHLFDAFSGAT